ncbi:MAG: Glyoxalase/bleomycin resistance protein/dioxygenase [Holophagaceae bacterium]|nr:Glyoxalase/bleomycin resistance protein/dioxygenase [Holophagaceae bacterium]
MIRIEHIAMWTENLDGLSGFYAKYFDATVGPAYHNPSKGYASRFLAFPSGARLELMKTTVLDLVQSAPGAQRMGLTHLAFSVGSEAQVDALTGRLEQDGVPVLDGPRRTGDGYYESVVLDPEGNRIEITA